MGSANDSLQECNFMTLTSAFHKAGLSLIVAATIALGSSAAWAQPEPTLNQVYAEAQAGRVDQAQVMMQQVLVAHPNSAKAHFVQAELFARQGKVARASESLARAEKLAPGLPFAKPQAVQALRGQLANPEAAPARAVVVPQAGVASPAASSSGFPWGLGLALGGAAIALVIFLTRRRPEPAVPMAPAYGGQGGLNGPQTFGSGPSVQSPGWGGGPAGGYGQQPAGTGMGGRIMGGVATGLAVGAGVLAAEAIGRNLMGGHDQPGRAGGNLQDNNYQPLAGNPDMGGQNFGVNDTSSWDDGAGSVASSDGGGDWDS